ncbi:MAG: receptor ligand binding region family protein [Bacillales bacterium]|jgi:branched-chain amino acid transport system substrate-binding protein|nr:receptor ligand binding region family protein [Bacillales bacterium]
MKNVTTLLCNIMNWGGSNMKSKKLLVIFSVVVLLLGVLSGCGSKKTTGDGSKVIKIATQTPLSGGSATLGEAIKLGAQMALEERKDEFSKLGYSLKLVPYDDQGDPKKGVSNANALCADKDVYAVVGHFNSGVAIPSSVVYEKNNVPMVSPSNTALEVTDRGLKTVNRICARDDLQAPSGAKFALDKLDAKTVFIIQDKTAYGSGLAEEFKKAFEKGGGKTVGYEGITVGEKDFNGVLNLVADKKPDLLYFAGTYPEGGLVIKQAREKGIKCPVLGADGLDSSTLVEIAGSSVKDVYLTSVAGDATKTETGKKFVENYSSKFNKQPESYSVYGYDCMQVILNALSKSIKDNGDKLPSKEKIRDAVRATKDFTGAMTTVTFDSKGDNENAKVYIYNFEEEKYPPTMVDEISK